MSLRIGIIGAGAYCATAHVPALQAIAGVEVAAVCRTARPKLEAFQARFGIPAGYTDYRQLLECETLDGVIVASPHRHHYEHARAVLERRLPLLLEKPVAVSAAQAEHLLALAQEQNVPVVVGYNRQYWHTFQTAARIMDEGRIGRIHAVEAVWRSDLRWALEDRAWPPAMRDDALWQPGDPPNFRADSIAQGGGAMADAGAHLCHAVTFLSRLEAERVDAYFTRAGKENDIYWTASVRFAGGAVGALSLLGACHEMKEHSVLLAGERGLLRVDDHQVELAVRGEPLQRIPKAWQRSVAENFVRVLQGRQAPVCTLHDGVRAQRLLSAILEAGLRTAERHMP